MVNFYCIDNIEFMKGKPDKYYDLAIVDPPYGKNADKGTNGFGTAKNRKYIGGWDNKTPEAEYWQELKRVSKNQIVFGANYFMENLCSTNCFIVWDKVGEYKFKNPFAQVELAWTSFTGVCKKYTVVQQGFINKNDTVIHPTQKPVELYRNILMDFATPEMKILDTHGGSFSSAIACDIEGIYLDICEIDNIHFKNGVKRFKEYKRQPTLCPNSESVAVKQKTLF